MDNNFGMSPINFPKKNPVLFLFAVTLIALGIILVTLSRTPSSKTDFLPENIVQNFPTESPAEVESSQPAQVTRVVDGDTIEVKTEEGIFKVRYIGMDTPETVDPRRPVACFGKEASQENKKLVEGKTVYLSKDVSETDKYGRLLRYVFLKNNDGSMLFINDYLVKEGFAKVYTLPPDVKFADKFVQSQKEARENNRGLWQKCQ